METTGLNENHQRCLITTYQYVDKILAEVEGHLRAAQSNSPFGTHVADANPVQCRVIEDYIFRIREVMARFLRDQEITLSSPRISAVWAARTALAEADIAIIELGPKYLRGYGELSPKAAQDLTEMVFELQSLFKQMGNFLSRQIEADPLARLKQLGQLTDEIKLLQELGRIIQLHGLVELRSTFALLVERAEPVHFEIAVFGRVSSGKSSLLNHILKTKALPVGVTPVTAVPIRIGYGEEPGATVHFAETKPLKIELALLDQYATEQHNPGNHKHVTGINIGIPQEQLKKGVKFVDTPGLGSLASSGTAETLAYLPRCDLGIVLVDAAATLTLEDLDILRLLGESGANTMVLLSKADLLNPEERVRMASYMKDQIRQNLKTEIPVFLVSALETQLADQWFQFELLPLFDKQRELAKKSLRLKIGTLSETVQTILRARLERGKKQPSPDQSQKRKAILQLIKEGSDLLAAVKNKCAEITREAESLPSLILKETANQLAGIWVKNKARQIQTGETLAKVLLEASSVLNQKLLKTLSETRTRLTEIFEKLSVFSTQPKSETDSLPEYRSLPILETVSPEFNLCLTKPFLSFIGDGFLERYILAALEKSGLKTILGDTLNLYCNQLNQWSQNNLAILRKDFEAQADYYQAGIVSMDNSASKEITPEQIARDLEILSSWPNQSKVESQSAP
ncbi:MAG: dynamin family protein [Firmicutes bacterium]|nr:dynamin family protein [Bacillota bacterium]